MTVKDLFYKKAPVKGFCHVLKVMVVVLYVNFLVINTLLNNLFKTTLLQLISTLYQLRNRRILPHLLTFFAKTPMKTKTSLML